MTLTVSPGAPAPVLVDQHTFRIVLVDAHCIFRQALRSLLASQGGFEVVGEAGRAGEALELIGTLQPDLLLTDLHLPDESGTRFIEQVHARFPKLAILVLTALRARGAAAAARKAGALGYLLKDQGRDELSAALREVVAGRWYSAEIPAGTRRARGTEASSSSARGLSHRPPAAGVALGSARAQHARDRQRAGRERAGRPQAARALAHFAAAEQHRGAHAFRVARGSARGKSRQLVAPFSAAPSTRGARHPSSPKAGFPVPKRLPTRISQVPRGCPKSLPTNPTPDTE